MCWPSAIVAGRGRIAIYVNKADHRKEDGALVLLLNRNTDLRLHPVRGTFTQLASTT